MTTDLITQRQGETANSGAPRRTSDHREYEAAARRALALGEADRLRLIETLREDLALAGEVETQPDRELRPRQDALDALRAAQAHLELAADEKLSPRQFDQAAKNLGLEWSASITTTQGYMHHIPKASDAGDLTRLVEREAGTSLPEPSPA